jgi:two-component system OmpR family response regulator
LRVFVGFPLLGAPVAKILVVDDNPDERQIYSAVLYYNGFDVLEADSGDEAIRVAKAAQPDLVLIDYMMPIMSGLAVAEQLNTLPETKSIPVVMMTAYDLSLERAKAAGARQLWHKPIPPHKLVMGLDGLLKAAERGPPE